MIERLTRRQEFKAAASGRRFHTARLTLQYRARPVAPPDHPAETLNGLRVGLTITRKVGTAVVRNRIRRRLREALRRLPEPMAALPADVVLIARVEALTAPFPLLVDDVIAGLTQCSGARRRRPERPGPALTSALPS